MQVKILEEAGQLPLAYVAASVHGLHEDAERIAQKVEEVPDLPSATGLLMPPAPILKVRSSRALMQLLPVPTPSAPRCRHARAGAQLVSRSCLSGTAGRALLVIRLLVVVVHCAGGQLAASHGEQGLFRDAGGQGQGAGRRQARHGGGGGGCARRGRARRRRLGRRPRPGRRRGRRRGALALCRPAAFLRSACFAPPVGGDARIDQSKVRARGVARRRAALLGWAATRTARAGGTWRTWSCPPTWWPRRRRRARRRGPSRRRRRGSPPRKSGSTSAHR